MRIDCTHTFLDKNSVSSICPHTISVADALDTAAIRYAMVASSDDPNGVFSIDMPSSPMTVEERDHRAVNITILRSAGLFGSATVSYRFVDNTTYSLANTADTTLWDFVQGSTLSHTVTFAAGQETAVVSVVINDDLWTEPAEMFTLELVSTTAGRISTTAGDASIGIIIGASDGPAEYVASSPRCIITSCAIFCIHSEHPFAYYFSALRNVTACETLRVPVCMVIDFTQSCEHWAHPDTCFLFFLFVGCSRCHGT